MHEPSTWGARPAQHANAHIEPADTVPSGTTIDSRPASKAAVSAILRARKIEARFVPDRGMVENRLRILSRCRVSLQEVSTDYTDGKPGVR
jgi:hypothetical protein